MDMKDTLFYNIVKFWNDMDEKDQLTLLQNFENLNSRFYNRK